MAYRSLIIKALDENGYHQIGAGFQGTYMNKRLNTANLKFEDQLTPFGFTGVTQENFPHAGKVNYFDLNAGFIYNGSTNGYNNFYLGASMYHINRPKESFQKGDFVLNARTTYRAGQEFRLALTIRFILRLIIACRQKRIIPCWVERIQPECKQ